MRVCRIGVSGASGSATLPEPWAKAWGVTLWLFRRAMWVPRRVGGYPGTTRSIERLWVQDNNKSLDPLREKKTFIRKKLGHTAVSSIQASSVTLYIWQKEPEENTVILYGSLLKDL